MARLQIRWRLFINAKNVTKRLSVCRGGWVNPMKSGAGLWSSTCCSTKGMEQMLKEKVNMKSTESFNQCCQLKSEEIIMKDISMLMMQNYFWMMITAMKDQNSLNQNRNSMTLNPSALNWSSQSCWLLEPNELFGSDETRQLSEMAYQRAFADVVSRIPVVFMKRMHFVFFDLKSSE